MDTLQTVLFVAPVLLFSVIAHEYAHGYAALKQGDTTAKELGRLTWNPIKHIDPVLTIIMPIVLFWSIGVALGGARPVPVNPENYRNRIRGDIIVSLAGVATNLALAVVFTVVIMVFGLVSRFVPVTEPAVGAVQAILVIGIQLNLLLVVFNLLPIPPLDGSHVAKYLLPPAWSLQYQRLGFAGMIMLVVLLKVAPGFLAWWFAPARYLFGALRSAVGGSLAPSYYGWIS